MFSTITTGALQGVKAYLVQVEVDISTGLPSFSMVGSLSAEVKEAKERVQVALRNAGMEVMARRITVNLSPANIRKEGTAFDLPIAVGVLLSLGYFSKEKVKNILFAGELGLNGEIKPVRGILPIVMEAAKHGIEECIVPAENALEGAVIPNIVVRGISNLSQLLRFFQTKEKKEEILPFQQIDTEQFFQKEEENNREDFADVSGQEAAKRAAEIAAAGFHNLLMIGPPGTGKSMIAKRISGILPPLTIEESLEVSAIYSVAGMLKETKPLVVSRPFQNPHHSISQAALTGGGTIPKPGAISLAHRGVLFLDELPEFPRTILDSMRQPLEERKVQITRVWGNISYPADCMLICAMNPCVCGYYPDYNRCTCSKKEVKRYLGKISGPILDRMDLCIEVSSINMTKQRAEIRREGSKEIRNRVIKAREKQKERFQGTSYCFNADILAADIEHFCKLGEKEQKLMEQAYTTMQLSARAYHRILKVARTIADLAGEEQISVAHLSEAICYRSMDTRYWNNTSLYH